MIHHYIFYFHTLLFFVFFTKRKKDEKPFTLFSLYTLYWKPDISYVDSIASKIYFHLNEFNIQSFLKIKYKFYFFRERPTVRSSFKRCISKGLFLVLPINHDNFFPDIDYYYNYFSYSMSYHNTTIVCLFIFCSKKKKRKRGKETIYWQLLRF